jgi:HrpA-like RNA helicase
LSEDPLLKNYQIVIVDEAHERMVNTDILLGQIQLLCKKRPDLRVIVTSATLDEELFLKYFNCPVFKVSGRAFPVKIKFQKMSYHNN